MVKDEWMRAAMSDDSLVVELLVRLKNSSTTTATATATSPLKSVPLPSPPPGLTWTVRMPRSRALRCGGDSSTRCSPTTPLSWSAGALSGSVSPSVTVDGGFEDDSARSKGRATNHEIASTTTTSRRSRKKKTFSELKEEENLLLKEKVFLKKELTKLRTTIRERTTENESLKRMKVQMGFESVASTSKRTTWNHQIQSCTDEYSFDNLISTPPTKPIALTSHQQNGSCEKLKAVDENEGGFFLLPDLNSTPCDEDDYCLATS